jgi:hypothetical protein
VLTSPRVSVGVCVTLALTVSAVMALGVAVRAGDQAIAVARIHAAVGPSTSLQVSSHLLVVAPQPPGQDKPVFAGAIDFRAAARTSSGGEVLLTVEPLECTGSPSGGPSETGTSVEFQGTGDGARSGVLNTGSPEAAARWVGSGVHTGRLAFTVRGLAARQGATIPLRFLLAAP